MNNFETDHLTIEGNEFVTDNLRKTERSSAKKPKSAIIALLDKFCAAVYDRLANGMFGRAFTSYPDIDNSLLGQLSESDFRKNKMSPARRAIASKMETCIFAKLWSKITEMFLYMRMKVCGVFFLSFFIYSALASGFKCYRSGGEGMIFVILSALLSLCAIPMLTSDQSVCTALTSSAVGRAVLTVTGSRPERFDKDKRTGRANAALAAALVLGVLSYFVPFYFILAGLVALAALAVIMNSPEFGVVLLFFFMPILPTAGLLVITCASMLSFIIKALLAKRLFRFETVDVLLVPYLLFTLVGTFFGASPKSLLSGSMTFLFICCFYLVTVTLTTREWLRRAVVAMLASGSIVSLYGLVQYVTQKVAGENEWVDQTMFSYITGRATATFDNPNMLSVYLIIVLPVAFAAVVAYSRSARERILSVISFLSVGACLLLTWTRGAWLGAIASFVILIMIWGQRSIYAFICGVLALPFLPYVVPEHIWARFTSIGNTADSSTAYRISILKSVNKMLPDYILHGLGVGEDSWYVIYPKIALEGVEWTAHSHNLYLQIWIQTGLISLIAVLIFFLYLAISNFSYFKRLSDADASLMSRISVAPLKDSGADAPTVVVKAEADEEKGNRRKKTVMRLEAGAPLCGIFAVLVMGFTDYVWYNFRIYLGFWLACGLCSAFVRVGRRELEDNRRMKDGVSESSSFVDLKVSPERAKGKDN